MLPYIVYSIHGSYGNMFIQCSFNQDCAFMFTRNGMTYDDLKAGTQQGPLILDGKQQKGRRKQVLGGGMNYTQRAKKSPLLDAQTFATACAICALESTILDTKYQHEN